MTLSEDHVHFTIGRQASSLKQIEEALKVFEKLLNVSSKQPALQQEFLFTKVFVYL